MRANYRSFFAWQRAHRLCVAVQQAANGAEDRGPVLGDLTAAALRIPTNVAKAVAFVGEPWCRRYLGLAMGFVVEVEYLLGHAAEQELLPGRCLPGLRRLTAETLIEVERLFLRAPSED